MDVIWAMMEGHLIGAAFPLPYIVNSTYYICATLTAAFWYFFVEAELGILYENRPLFHALLLTPLCSTIALMIANWFNHCIFSFDEDLRFIRGPLTFEIYLIPLIYLILSAIHPLIRSFQKIYYAQRQSYLYLAAFGLITISATVLQFFLPGTPLPCLGMSIAILLVFMNRQELLISLDPLTKLNNRQQMMTYLSQKMRFCDEGKELYLLIMDLNHFKAINDRFGHIEGDNALVLTADVLRQAAASFGCFISRYGGDEFILIYEAEDQSRVDELCSFIHAELSKIGGEKYSLSACIGYARYTETVSHIPGFIAMADESLYQKKRERKSQSAKAQ